MDAAICVYYVVEAIIQVKLHMQGCPEHHSGSSLVQNIKISIAITLYFTVTLMVQLLKEVTSGMTNSFLARK